MRSDRGSASVEMVLLAPVLMVMVLLVAYAGRSTQALVTIRQAADRGARAASMVHPSRMESIGKQAVFDDLQRSGMRCEQYMVNVAFDGDASVRSVLVEVECTVNQQGLALLGLRDRTLYAKSIEVIDVWRVD
jgi:Flp pilus assembly protein TadG